MSYSFSVNAATKHAAKHDFSRKFAEVVLNGQLAHAREMHAANAAAHAFIGMLQDHPAKDIVVSVNGSVGWDYHSGVDHPTPEHLTSVSFQFSVYQVAKAIPTTDFSPQADAAA